jgi:hypothetical protein
MRKESIIIFSLAALVSIGIVGALSYFHYKSNQRQATPATTEHQPPPVSTPNKKPYANVRQPTRKAPAHRLLKYPQKCINAQGNVIYTNQPNCKNAAPKSNFSIVESVSPVPRQSKPQNQSQTASSNTTDKKLAKKPNLRLFGVTPPRDTPRECKFPVGKALEIERSLSAAKDPAKSIWKKSYCRWIREARQDGCEISREYFYYSHLCSGYG